MTERALIHVAGPQGAGKTAFIEAVLEAGGLIFAARCVRDDSLRRSREDTPTSHPELRRYRAAGACGAALFTFPQKEAGSDAFFVTHLMEDYSQATILEGDDPLEFADLAVFVAPPLPAGKTLLVRGRRDRAKEARDRTDALEGLLHEPHGVTRFLGQAIGAPLAAFARERPELLEEIRADLLAGIVQARRTPPPEPTEHWAIAEGYEGIERAQLVVVNVRGADEHERGEALAREVGRLRKDAAVFHDIVRFRGHKTPITVAVADLLDRKDAGRKKAVARVRRVLGAGS
ncbi:MAG: hypothetical protein NTU62_17200 [Spirochaetes bacterium]|nr:hypothetical protein [Spirochaetota bacterium]